ncbi:TetR/AcrR family transcriptional regulator [Sulfitobacter aestuariivivens]|uniref:TetR/AcrR family transcriptional regulator n=1 Tax=Sulfitobacter aestuariivivens TaxID=2766981 RepID=UPI003615322C
MKKADATREKLLTEGRRLMWMRGYRSVSLREIAQAAKVDVALVSRYFGGKKGLFEATLVGAFAIENFEAKSHEALVDTAVSMFVSAPREGTSPP